MAAPAPLPVLLAVTGEPYEDVVVAALGGARGRLAVVRRCVDLADLLAAAQAGTARAALVAAGLRRWTPTRWPGWPPPASPWWAWPRPTTRSGSAGFASWASARS